MSKFNFRAAGGQSAELLSPQAFIARYFGNVESYSTMVVDLEQFAPNLRANLEFCINGVKLGYKINSVIRQKRHKATDMPYIYSTMSMRNGEVPLMLLNEANLFNFLDDYQSGKVKIEFNFQELMSYINS
jgi:hypothetical protein